MENELVLPSEHEPLSASLLAMRLDWDVLLSFDTRDGFIAALYSSLCSSRVRTFMGDATVQGPYDAVQDSAAAIAVISPGYADSHSRLEELARLFDFNKLVVPVFYRVNPSHVRSAAGPFHDSFKLLNQEHGEERVNRWEKALKMAGDRSGYVLYTHSDESQTIKTIVKRILDELSTIPTDIAAYPVGLDSRVNEVVHILNLQSKGVQFLGIHGQPGIGKTTLAKAVFSRLVPYFKRRCLISNLKETLAKEGGLITIQNKLLSDLSLQVGRPPVKDEESGRSSLMRLLTNEIQSEESGGHDHHVLVVLDDIGIDQLKKIGIEREWLAEGSRILTTSRDEDILLSFSNKDELYEAKELLESEALELFSYHALRRKNPTEEFSSLSKEIISWTGGLPLAIEVFGSVLLEKRTTREWENSLEKLRRVRPPNLQDVLKLSYDELSGDHRCIFLDISCLFIQVGMKREDAIDIFNGCGFAAEEAIHLLRKKSLLKITRDDVLWMHDQIRDMGRQIVIQQGVDNLRNRSRLWNYADILYVLNHDTGSDKVRGVIFDTGKKRLMVSWDAAGSSSALTVGSEDSDANLISFQTLRKVELLQINEVQFNGDLNNMPTKLRWLKWKGCPWKSLPSTLPREIRVLDLSESKLECLWSSKWIFWSYNQVIKNLTVLNLSNNYHLTSIPDISENRLMKKLILEGCVKLNKIHKSLGGMTSLVQLNLRRCTSLIEFPSDISGLIHLEELILSECRALSKLPCDFRSLTSLRELHLDDTAIKELPSLVYLTRLELMMLNRCMELKSLPTDVGGMQSLKILSISGSGVEMLPDSVGDLKCLEQLKLEHCASLKIIPESVGKLKSLSRLYLTSTPIRMVPGTCFSLPSLKSLSLTNCSLETLPTSIGGLCSIVELHLDGSWIHELPREIGSLQNIQTLDLRKCTSLTRLPESIGDLFSLSVLNLADTSIVELPDSIGALENLITLRLNRCKSLTKLPSTFGNLKSLHHLWMEETAITELPQSIGMLSKLVILKMKKKLPLGESSAELPPSLGNLSMLHEFDARAWNICGQIPENFNCLSHMETLDLGHNSFHSLPSSLQGLSSLRKLLLPHCRNLELLPPLPSSLTELNVANCSALSCIPDLSNLSNLEELQLTNCDKVQDVAGLEKLKTLRRVYMAGCKASASAVRQRLSKATYEKLGYLGIPGSQIPNWFSTEPVIFSSCVTARVKSVLIAVILSVKIDSLSAVQVKADSLIDILATSPLSAVQVKIWRAGKAIFNTVLSLTAMPNTCEYQLYLCRFKDFHPLVSLLEDGDKLDVSLVQWYESSIELKTRGIHIVYDNNDTYDGNEDMLEYDQQSVSMKLAGFFQSLHNI